MKSQQKSQQHSEPESTPKPKPESPRKTRGRPRKSETHGSYEFVISNWEISYSISIESDSRFSRAGFGEHPLLEITAQVIDPENLKDQSVRISLIGRREMDVDLDADPFPMKPWPLIGVLHIRKDRSDYLGSIPLLALWGLLPALIANEIVAISMSGDALHRGKADIRWIGFHSHRDLE